MSAAVRFTVYCTYYMYMQKNIYVTYTIRKSTMFAGKTVICGFPVGYRRELFSQVCKQVDLSDIFPKTF